MFLSVSVRLSALVERFGVSRMRISKEFQTKCILSSSFLSFMNNIILGFAHLRASVLSEATTLFGLVGFFV